MAAADRPWRFWLLALLWLPAGLVLQAAFRFGGSAEPMMLPALLAAAGSLVLVAPCGLPLALGLPAAMAARLRAGRLGVGHGPGRRHGAGYARCGLARARGDHRLRGRAQCAGVVGHVLARAAPLTTTDSQRPDRAREPARALRLAAVLGLPAAVAAWSALLAAFDSGGPPIAFVLLQTALATPFGLPLGLACVAVARLGRPRAAWSCLAGLGAVPVVLSAAPGIMGLLALLVAALAVSVPVWLAVLWMWSRRRP